jgi:hypothetical protein
MRPRGAILQTDKRAALLQGRLRPAPPPFAGRRHRDAAASRRLTTRTTSLHIRDQSTPTGESEPRVTVKPHPGPSFDCEPSQTHSLEGGPDDLLSRPQPVEARHLAAYLTSDFHDSEWTDQEVGAALARGLLVFPLRVDVNPYGFIGRYQAMHAAGKDPHGLAKEIASVLHSDPLTRFAMAEVVVDRFVHSYSYDDARANLKRLQTLSASRRRLR